MIGLLTKSQVPGSWYQKKSRTWNRVPDSWNVVGQGGLEPPTPRLSSVCSNQLSY